VAQALVGWYVGGAAAARWAGGIHIWFSVGFCGARGGEGAVCAAGSLLLCLSVMMTPLSLGITVLVMPAKPFFSSSEGQGRA
jgi:hypothetical protein